MTAKQTAPGKARPPMQTKMLHFAMHASRFMVHSHRASSASHSDRGQWKHLSSPVEEKGHAMQVGLTSERKVKYRKEPNEQRPVERNSGRTGTHNGSTSGQNERHARRAHTRAQRQRMKISGQNECHARRAHVRAQGKGWKTNHASTDPERGTAVAEASKYHADLSGQVQE